MVEVEVEGLARPPRRREETLARRLDVPSGADESDARARIARSHAGRRTSPRSAPRRPRRARCRGRACPPSSGALPRACTAPWGAPRSPSGPCSTGRSRAASRAPAPTCVAPRWGKRRDPRGAGARRVRARPEPDPLEVDVGGLARRRRDRREEEEYYLGGHGAGASAPPAMGLGDATPGLGGATPRRDSTAPGQHGAQNSGGRTCAGEMPRSSSLRRNARSVARARHATPLSGAPRARPGRERDPFGRGSGDSK